MLTLRAPLRLRAASTSGTWHAFQICLDKAV